MEIGIFAKTFQRPTLTEVLDAVVAHNLHIVQFNMACAGLPSMPAQIDDATAETIRNELAARQITMAAVSGTFNMIHPDLDKRRDGLNRLHVLAAAAKSLGTSIITLCTGTCDPDDMWRWHPDNEGIEAWRALVESMRTAIEIADTYDVTLAFEPEVANVIDRPVKGRRLLDELGSPRIKVVIDGANLFHTGALARMHAILDDAFAQLGKDIVLAHAKDLTHDGAAGHSAAGKGRLDFAYYLTLLKQAGYDGPLIMHGLDESEVEQSTAFLRERLEEL